MLLTNENGRQYKVLKQKGLYMLLVAIETDEVIVIWNWNKKYCCWSQGYYYNLDTLQQALNLFEDKSRKVRG